MAVQAKPDWRFTGIHAVRKEAFERMVERCENPPKPSQALKDLVSKGRSILKKA